MALLTNLKAYYKFDGNNEATDSHSASLNLTNNNSVSYSASGKLKRCASFDGSNDNFSSSASGLQVTGDMTVAMWVNPSARASESRYLLWNTYSGSTGLITSLDWTGSNFQMRFAIYNSSGSPSSKDHQSTVTIPTGSWSHIAFVYTASSGTLEYYLNGTKQGSSVTGFPTSIISKSNAYLGIDGNGGAGNYMKGLIDEFGLWGEALTGSDISSLYNSGNGNSHPFTTGISISNTKTATASGATSVTYTGFEVAGDNPALIVSVCDQNNGGSTTGVTCNGVAMTLIDTQAIAGSNGVTLWGLYAPTTGNIVATRTGTGDRITICAVNYTGVKQTTALTSLPKAKATSSGNISASVTTTVDNSWVTMGTYVSAGGDVSSAGSNTTKRVVGPEIEDHWDSGSAITPAGSRTLAVTNSGTPTYAYIILALEPYVASASQIKTRNGVAIASVKTANGVANT